MATSSNMAAPFNVGIDFGGVLSSHDSKVGAQHVNTRIDMPLAMENLRKLKDRGHKLYLISFCGRARAMETDEALKQTKMPNGEPCASLFESIYFVKDRDFKRQLCEHLGCHFMIDDRADILANISKSVCNTIPVLFGKEYHPSYTAAKDWNRVFSIIESTRGFPTKCQTHDLSKLIHKV